MSLTGYIEYFVNVTEHFNIGNYYNIISIKLNILSTMYPIFNLITDKILYEYLLKIYKNHHPYVLICTRLK